MDGPGKATSYWTRRRHVRNDVERHLASIANELEQQTDAWLNSAGGSLETQPECDYRESQTDYYTDLADHATEPAHQDEIQESPSQCDLTQITDPVNRDIIHSSTEDSEGSDLDESEDQYGNGDTLAESITNWVLQFGVTLVALTSLLTILKVFHPSLPKDARTLLRTKRSSGVQQKAGGSYYYFGILSTFHNFLSDRVQQLEDGSCLKLQINVDGLPLFKSLNAQLWPILGSLQGFDNQPHVIGLYCGSKKPASLEEFLQDFVTDINSLEQGFQLNGKRLNMNISTVLCDAPAMAFLKNVKSHNGYYGCQKCIQSGKYISNRMTFPETESPLRTDAQFDAMTDEDHHHGESPLNRTSIGMVSQFPLDYMHLVCLGVTRRLLNLWIKGPLLTRLPARLVRQLSDNLEHLRNSLPLEFARKPRAVSEIDRWKATEFRQFLLYTGPIVLSGILKKAVYKNFMLLSVAMYLLASPHMYMEYCDYSHDLLVLFVNHYAELYGKELIVLYNIHGLVHLVNDVRTHGPLDKISCFPFENYLKELKKMVRKPHLPLSQVVCRLTEKMRWKTSSSKLAKEFRMEHSNGPVPRELSCASQYKEIALPVFRLRTEEPDNCIAVGEDVALVRNILICDVDRYVVIERFSRKVPLYDYPLKAHILGIYKVLLNDLSGNLEYIPVSCVLSKCVFLPDDNGFAVIPLLHHG